MKWGTALLFSAVAGFTTSGAYPGTINGTETSKHPAVGMFVHSKGACTATLVMADVLLTAGHCVEHSVLVGVRDAYFRLDDGRRIVVEGWYGFGDSVGVTDVALVFLAKPVRGVKPMEISSSYPRRGSKLQFVGYGCNRIDLDAPVITYSGQGVKREFWFSSDRLSLVNFQTDGIRICFGDSGGPLIDGATGQIVGVASGFGVRVDEIGKHLFVSSAFGDAVRLRHMLSGVGGNL